jgi:hypothetical protein
MDEGPLGEVIIQDNEEIARAAGLRELGDRVARSIPSDRPVSESSMQYPGETKGDGYETTKATLDDTSMMEDVQFKGEYRSIILHVTLQGQLIYQDQLWTTAKGGECQGM